MKYNNMPEVLNSTEEDLEEWVDLERKTTEFREWYGNKETDNPMYRKGLFDRKRKKFISVFVYAGISLALLAELAVLGYFANFAIDKYNEFKVDAEVVAVVTDEEVETVEVEDEVHYDFENIRSAIEKNPNIGDREKEFLYKLKFVFDENYQYMDLDMVISRLEMLSITYIEGACQREGLENYAAGLYLPGEDKIECYYATSFDNVDINVFLHEFFHVLQQDSNDNKLKELSDEALTREVIRRLHEMGELEDFEIINVIEDKYWGYGQGYSDNIHIYYYLAELLSQDKLKKYQFDCNEASLAYSLASAISSEDSDLYYENVNLAFEMIQLINDHVNIKEFGSEEKLRIEEKILGILEYFYQQKGMSMKSNANCLTAKVSYAMGFASSTGEFLLEYLDKGYYMEYEEYVDMSFLVKTYPKSYFSDTYKEGSICLSFAPSNNNRATQILEANGDLNASHVVKVDEEFLLKYKSYMEGEYKSR